jgi:predicted HicB family RNase H-like nuclease
VTYAPPMPAKKGPGRPPRAGKKLSTGRVELRLTEQEHARWLREAARREMPLSQLIRVAFEAYVEK